MAALGVLLGCLAALVLTRFVSSLLLGVPALDPVTFIAVGLLLAIETPMRRALDNVRLWAATVLINSMIMTVYLWHMSVLAAVAAIIYYLGGYGLGVEPGSAAWWYTRPAWIGFLMVVLLPVATVLAAVERSPRRRDVPPSAARQVIGRQGGRDYGQHVVPSRQGGA